MKTFLHACLIAFFAMSSAAAQEQATVVFKSGLVVTIDSAYKQLVDAMKRGEKGVVEMNIQGNQFLVRMDDVSAVYKERCLSMTIISPARR